MQRTFAPLCDEIGDGRLRIVRVQPVCVVVVVQALLPSVGCKTGPRELKVYSLSTTLVRPTYTDQATSFYSETRDQMAKLVAETKALKERRIRHLACEKHEKHEKFRQSSEKLNERETHSSRIFTEKHDLFMEK